MATFSKKPGNSFAGTSASDLILVSRGEFADTGTIAGSFGFDTLRFSSGLEGDLLFIGTNITGIERVQIGGGTGSTPTATTVNLDIDASAALNSLSFAGNAGDNVIIGTLFHDSFAVSAGADELYGGNGDDVFTIFSRQSYDPESVIDGEGGIDTLKLSDNGMLVLGAATYVESVEVTLSFTGGIDASAIFNDAGIAMNGSLGANHLIGTELDDTIVGGGGRDTLEGGGGNDVFLIAIAADHAVDEVLDGGDGVDEIRFTSTGSSGNNLVLRAGVAVERVVLGDAAGNTSGTTDLWVDARAVDNPLEIVGNNGNNRITGTADADTLLGGGGFDLFFVNAPGDHAAGEVIDGGAGLDEIALSNTAPATFVLQASTSVEFIRFTSPANVGESNIDGSALAAGVSFQGTNGANRITGGSGNDVIAGLGGDDTLLGGDGDDAFQYSRPMDLGDDVIDGGAGEDRLVLQALAGAGFAGGPPDLNTTFALPALIGIESIELGNSLFTLPGSGLGISVLATGATAGANIVGTFGVAYVVSGSAHDDTIAGAGGNDVFLGITGDDSLAGGAGDDFLAGHSGGDTLAGGDGSDTLIGNEGADSLDGGDGSDLYLHQNHGLEYQEDVMTDSGDEGIDTLSLFFQSALLPEAPLALPLDAEGIERIEVAVNLSGTAGDFAFDFSAVEQALILRARLLTSQGGGSSTVLTGSEYGDRFEPDAWKHRYVGGGGNDTFAGASARSRYEGGDGDDVVWLDGSFKLPSSWSGIESVALADTGTGATGGTQARTLSAAASSNALELIGNDGHNHISGTRYDDTITGNGGRDTLLGGLGDDTIDGGAGADAMFGGGGNDVFLGFNAGDRVRGDAGDDTLVLEGSGIALDLTAIANTAIRGVETFDIRGDGANQLTLAFGDVKGNLGVGGTLRIVADADDEVALAGTWTNLGTDGDVTTYSATSRGQTVFVEVEAPPSGALTYDAIDGTDSFVGGSGNDTINFGAGDFDPSADFIDGGGGFDTLVVDGLTLDMGEAFFSNLERIELSNGAALIADDGAFEVVAIAGSNEAQLGSNAAQSYTGNASGDDVLLGAAGQEVHTGAGNDEVEVGNDELAGSVLDLGGDALDQLFFEGAGAASMLDAESISAGLRISYGNGITSLTLDNGGHRVAMNANMDATLASGDNSGGDDTFAFGSNDWSGRLITIDGFAQGAGNDQIEIGFASFAGEYYGETTSDGVDALLPDDGLRNGVFDTELSALLVDFDRSGTFGAGDLRINLAGVSDLTAGADIAFL
jgi:Ca2+-binding RTX toxin-like protein